MRLHEYRACNDSHDILQVHRNTFKEIASNGAIVSIEVISAARRLIMAQYPSFQPANDGTTCRERILRKLHQASARINAKSFKTCASYHHRSDVTCSHSSRMLGSRVCCAEPGPQDSSTDSFAKHHDAAGSREPAPPRLPRCGDIRQGKPHWRVHFQEPDGSSWRYLQPMAVRTQHALPLVIHNNHVLHCDYRANGSIQFEFNDPPNAGLAFGIQLLQVNAAI